MKKILVFFLLLLLMSTAKVWAGDVWTDANSTVYGTKAGGMLGRGLMNVLTCFVDVFVQTVEQSKTGPPLIGTLTGVASGAGCTVLRAGSGALDVVTFWIPGFNGIPVSRSYKNCLEVDEMGTEVGTQELPAPSYGEPAPAARPTAESWTKPAAPRDTGYNRADYVKK